MRDLHHVEQEVAIVHGVEAKFRVDVTDVSIFKRLVGLEVADLDDEGVGTIGFFVNYELRHDDGVVGKAAERADPPFASGEIWRVQREGLVGGVPDGDSFEAPDVAAMGELGLRVAADDFVALGFLDVEVVMFGSALISKFELYCS